jgi:hypothetical protein
MNHQNQSHPVQLVAKFTAFPAINPPTYPSRLVSASPATAATIVGKTTIITRNSFLGCINLKRLIWGTKIFLASLTLMHPN